MKIYAVPYQDFTLLKNVMPHKVSSEKRKIGSFTIMENNFKFIIEDFKNFDENMTSNIGLAENLFITYVHLAWVCKCE